MFNHRTVLILGAGASMPYKFPSGRDLLFDITDELKMALHHKSIGGNPDQLPLIYQACKWFKFSDQTIEYFTNALDATMQPSIDAFLERYPDYMKIGKVAIAASLIPYENRKVIMQRNREKKSGTNTFLTLSMTQMILRKIIFLW